MAPRPTRIRLSIGPGWEIVREAPLRARAAAAADPFVARALATGRLELQRTVRARPRRAGPAAPGVLAAEVDARRDEGYVVVARHPSGALTFHRPLALAGAAHAFEVPLLPAEGRRSVLRTVAVFVLKAAGTFAAAALPFLARLWETKRFAAAGAPLGLVKLSTRNGSLAAVRAKTLPGEPSLLFLHGTFSHAAAGFGDLAKRGTVEALSAAYGGRVFAFNHLTVGRAVEDNVKDLVAAARGATLDVVTHSRGGLVLRLLAKSPGGPRIRRAFLAAAPSEGTPLASPARWDELAAWVANLGEALPSGALAFGLDFAAEALVWMAKRAGGSLPGLAAMNPAGEFLAGLNASAPDPRARFAAAIADFEPKGGLAKRLLDAGADAFFQVPNDLVVPTEGGLALGGARRVGESDALRFEGGTVHHCNLFAQARLEENLKSFFESEESRGAFAPRTGRGGVRRRAPRPAPGAARRDLRAPKPYSPSKKLPGARSALPSSRFELLLVDGEPPRLVATWAGARVVETFETKGGAAGERMRRIIALHERVLRALDGRSDRPLPTASELTAYGAVLFETLFPGEVRRLWDAARGSAKGPLELSFTAALDWIADKPWELCWDPSRRRFLADDAVLVRNVFGAVPPERAAPRRGPLRVLVAAAQPRDATPVSARAEADAIRAALAPLVKAGLVDLDVLPAATASGLHRRLSAGRPDVLHFAGHGTWDDAQKTGALLLVDGRGRGAWIDSERVCRMVAGRGLRLVVLNACETGRGGRNDFLRGVAPALLAGGVPAIVANQYKVLDSSATAFAQHLYRELARGHALGPAAREARVAVAVAHKGEPMDWAVPVLYARDTSLVFARPQKR